MIKNPKILLAIGALAAGIFGAMLLFAPGLLA